MELDFDLENPFSTSFNNYPLLFQIEKKDHSPISKSYLQTAKSNPSTRNQLVSLILCFCRNFDFFSSYLAINYMDRFLSATSLPEEKQPWVLRAIAVSSTSLALKMRKIDFSVSHFQNDGGMILDSVTVERAEMLILGALQWRMRSVNPFCFINFFISFIGMENGVSIQALKDKTIDIILRAQNDVKLLEFKPSVISSAALLSAAADLFPSELSSLRNSISCCEYVSKLDVLKCYNIIEEASAPTSSSNSTPYNVLDFQCSTSSASQNKPITSETDISSNIETRVPKRRRFGGFGSTVLREV